MKVGFLFFMTLLLPLIVFSQFGILKNSDTIAKVATKNYCNSKFIQKIEVKYECDPVLISGFRYNNGIIYIDTCYPTSTGGVEVDPIWSSEKSGYATLPITFPSETDPVWSADKPNYVTSIWIGTQGYLTSFAEADPAWSIDKPGYATTLSLAGKADVSHTQAISTITDLQTNLNAKQATLVSGTNIKTINGSTILGSGDVTISGGGNGYALHFQCLTSSMASATTYYIGCEPFAATTTQTIPKVKVVKTGTIKAAFIEFRRTNGTYTSGNLVVSINVDNVATQLGSVANFNTPQTFSSTALNIAVTAGQVLQIKVLTPTLSVAGTACFVSGHIYIE